MQVHVFTQSIKIGQNSGGVGFRVLAEALPAVTISLSRVVGKCLFNIDRLWEHDGHSPIFTSSLNKEVYIKRVVDEIHMKLSENLLTPWYETDYTCITTEDGKTWETAATLDINPLLKINSPPTKFHGPAFAWENIMQDGGTLVDPAPVNPLDVPFTNEQLHKMDTPPEYNEDGSV